MSDKLTSETLKKAALLMKKQRKNKKSNQFGFEPSYLILPDDEKVIKQFKRIKENKS